MFKKYLGILLLLLGISSVLIGFIIINSVIKGVELTVRELSFLVDTLILGVPLIIYGVKFRFNEKWKYSSGIIIIIISLLYLISTLVSILYIKDISKGIVIIQIIITICLFLFGVILKKYNFKHYK